ncbi:MAG: signal peptidase I [Clostridia bacterium]|nr:signal peptidase I [Clostridia bacterium]
MGRVEENAWEYGRLRRMSLLWTLAVAAIVILLVFGVWLKGVQIADEGMAPTLRAGDVVLFDALKKYAVTPRRGDIYAVKRADGVYLGRIIGLPGETVEMDAGNVYINGYFLSENAYVQYAPAELAPVTLGDAQFFILPDSRAYMIPQTADMIVDIDDLYGCAAVRVSPLSHFAIFYRFGQGHSRSKKRPFVRTHFLWKMVLTNHALLV